MVYKKKLDFGFNGFQVPFIPKAPRSVRRRRSCKKIDDGQICAFELLAAVAGKLLLESESSTSSNAAEGKNGIADGMDGIKSKQVEEGKAVKSECLDQGSCVESAYIPETAAQEQNLKHGFEKPYHAKNNYFLEHTSTVIGFEADMKLENCKEVNIANGKFHPKIEGGSSNLEDPCDNKIRTGTQKHLDDDSKQIEDVTVTNTCSVKNPIEECVNNSCLFNSGGSVQLPLYRDSVPSASFVKQRNSVKLGIRDDDENSFDCYRCSTKLRAFRTTSRLGYRRIRKMLKSRYWKVAPKLKEYERSYTNGGVESFYLSRKSIRARKRCQLEVPSKRRKLSNHGFAVAYYQEASSESVTNSPDKEIKRDINTSHAIPPRGTVDPAPVKNHHKKDPNVKFSIKSFKVPELYIEVPETATVGSLKRTVMEAVTAILESGLRVGVVLQGKKVRDDNRTLEQAGISQNGNLDNLGFTLEPRFTQVSPSSSPNKLPASSTYVADQELTRRRPSPILELGIHNASSDPLETEIDSRALVIVPPVNAEALAMVPLNQKSKRSELSQRRIRRPFSVAEVEALVEAVEHLGTGRWRDVKMRAFDNADHRTYVDLKDKWKTLVHTASIAPQQRRGEPVPQELLDRVLAAHAYWSQQQGKHHAEPLKTPDAKAQKVGA
ncbi:telomere repeat-binding protein 3 isoform X2 [Solanum dulcamara]|uniref:telomere repeat-binding protein 3 isoform X2 n=1 Tax=Solanum dulcamara TaxID=45834 RepID=UPI0024869BD4|nr:telomere repeat-binding protein 3 isoform X2 [Solanum dulcamara]